MRFLVFIFSLLSFSAFAQDSARTLELQEFLGMVMETHPIVKQSNLLSEYGRQEIRLARGNFDPKLSSTFQTKDFNNKNYYSLWNTELKIPTWSGVELKAGFDRNQGVYVNPEDYTPKQGLEYIGIAVPLAQGMLIDMRRATLREAQLFREISEAERLKAINKVILQAAKDYWNWYNAYHQYELARTAQTLAQVRFEGVVQRVLNGDLAPIDSTEAQITVQQREILLSQAELELNNTRLMLSNHLWHPDGEPLELETQVAPTRNVNDPGQQLSLEELHAFARENHPELLKLTFKLRQLDVQRRLNIEMLKPVINVKYNMLQLTGRSVPVRDENFFVNNYKFGVDFSFPLFLRKERAKLQQTNIKIQQTGFDRIQANREIINNITATYNEMKNLEQLLIQQEKMVNNYRLLLAGEQDKFAIGESSVFMVNSRESKLIEGEMKLIEMQTKYAKARAGLVWAAGRSQ